MNIARILSITPAGKAWTNEHGTLYPFTVAFDDGRAGEVNAKSNPPGYRVGEVCGYDVTGQTPRGVDKFKITRNPDPAKGRFTGRPEEDRSNPDLEAAPPRNAPSSATQGQGRSVAQTAPREPSSLPVNLPHGATVGGALARAVDLAIYTEGVQKGGWGEESIALIERITRDLVDIQRRIENGEPPANQPF